MAKNEKNSEKQVKNSKMARLLAMAEAIDHVDTAPVKPRGKAAKASNAFVLPPSVVAHCTVSKKKRATVTITISDLHLGHLGFLPRTYESAVKNLAHQLRLLAKFFNFVKVKVVLNGDVVSGKEVYEAQVFDNAVSRGHWQVTLAAEILYRTIVEIKRALGVKNVEIYIIKGTHEPEAENYAIYLSREIDAKYVSRYPIINIGEPLGYYPVLFMHGVGSNSYFPVSTATIRQCQNYLLQNPQKRCNTIRTAHTHWLTPEFELSGGLKIAVSGGFQKFEPKLDQRPSGMLIDIFTEEGETCNIPVRPDPEIERSEKEDGLLEFKNYAYYGRVLLSYGRRVIGAVDSGVLYSLFKNGNGGEQPNSPRKTRRVKSLEELRKKGRRVRRECATRSRAVDRCPDAVRVARNADDS